MRVVGYEIDHVIILLSSGLIQIYVLQMSNYVHFNSASEISPLCLNLHTKHFFPL